MLANRPSGQGAASKKYDVLTALGALACGGDKHRQRLILRFMTLVTARYNWQRDEVRIGRAEIARLWRVDERTVKRDLSKLKLAGWVTVKYPAARGRVTVYSIDWDRVIEATRETWPAVGRDFVDRMDAMMGTAVPASAPDTNIVAFPQPPGGASEWDQVCAHVHRADPAFFASWLSSVERAGRAQGILELVAPTPFHAQYLNTHALTRLTGLVRDVDPDVHRIVFRSK